MMLYKKKKRKRKCIEKIEMKGKEKSVNFVWKRMQNRFVTDEVTLCNVVRLSTLQCAVIGYTLALCTFQTGSLSSLARERERERERRKRDASVVVY